MSNNQSTHELPIFPKFDSKEIAEGIGLPLEYNVEAVAVVERAVDIFDTLEDNTGRQSSWHFASVPFAHTIMDRFVDVGVVAF